jgi:RNA polymerase sporulation-specific sigma factor
MEDYRTLDYKTLIEKAQNGDKNAAEKIVQENVGLVWSIVKKFSNRGYEADDLFQIGSIGLLKCIYKFDAKYEVKFSTYAVPMIMGEIKRFLRDDGMIKVSRPLKELSVKAKYAKERITQERGKEPTISELAEELKAETNDLILALEAGMEVESLYSAIYQGDGTPIYLIDKLELSKDSNESLVDMIALKEIIKGLNPKERQVIVMRYFDDKTQTEVANAIGVSQVQVSRIEKKVLNVIREKFA